MTPRIFIESRLAKDSIISLDKIQSNYLTNVLRMKPNASVLLFNGQDGEWIGQITNPNSKSASVTITDKIKAQTNTNKLTLLFAPTKNINSSYIIEKATELGVTDILPILTQRSVVNKVNIEKLKHSAIEAAEQCERLDIPKIHDIQPLKKTITELNIKGSLLFFDESKKCLSISKIQPSALDNAILIGPEGGFSDEESAFLKNLKHCIPTHMGVRILRADTAVIAGLASYQAIFGDWNNE